MVYPFLSFLSVMKNSISLTGCILTVYVHVLKKTVKKFLEPLAGSAKSRTFATAFRKGRHPTGDGRKGKTKKVSEKFAGMKKTPYLCRRFPSETGASSLKDFG